jgi:hypothetical protein
MWLVHQGTLLDRVSRSSSSPITSLESRQGADLHAADLSEERGAIANGGFAPKDLFLENALQNAVIPSHSFIVRSYISIAVPIMMRMPSYTRSPAVEALPQISTYMAEFPLYFSRYIYFSTTAI